MRLALKLTRMGFVIWSLLLLLGLPKVQAIETDTQVMVQLPVSSSFLQNVYRTTEESRKLFLVFKNEMADQQAVTNSFKKHNFVKSLAWENAQDGQVLALEFRDQFDFYVNRGKKSLLLTIEKQSAFSQLLPFAGLVSSAYAVNDEDYSDLEELDAPAKPAAEATKPPETPAAPAAAESTPPPAEEAPKEEAKAADPVPPVSDEAAPSAPSEAEKPAPAKEPEEMRASNETPGIKDGAVLLSNIEFKQYANFSRITLTTEQPLQYQIETDEKRKQFIAILKNATIQKRNLERHIDTSQFDSAVNIIQAYRTTSPYVATRVIFQLNRNVKPIVSQDGNYLYFDFPRTNHDRMSELNKFEQQLKVMSKPAIDCQLVDNDGEEKKTFSDKKVSLRFKDADVADVLAMIAESSGYSIIVSDDVSGKISISLNNTPWDQALSIVLASHKLGCQKSGNVIRVASIRGLSQEYEETLSTIESREKLLPLKTLVIPISYGQATEYIIKLKAFLTERGKISIDERTNTVIVTDIIPRLRKIRSLIANIDKQTPQVQIEAKIVEANKSFSRQFGMDWALSATGSGLPLSGTVLGVDFMPLKVVETATSLGKGAMSAFSNLTIGSSPLNINLQLQLAETDELVKIISSPRIVVDNNTESNLTQGQSIPYKTLAFANTFQNENWQFVEAKLELKVKPHITTDGAVILAVHIVRSYPGPQESVNIPPQIFSRTLQTSVLVPNGDTTVIGGIYSVNKQSVKGGIPFLREIPILGALFGKDQYVDARNELLIFITPRIMTPEKGVTHSELEG